jgi:hypothetical protein
MHTDRGRGRESRPTGAAAGAPDDRSNRYATDGGTPDGDADRDDGPVAETTVTEAGITVVRRVTTGPDGIRVEVDLEADDAGTRSVRLVESFGPGVDVRDVRPIDEYREDWAAGQDGLEFRTVLGTGDATRTAYGLQTTDPEAVTGDPTVEVEDLAGGGSGSLMDRITGFLGGSRSRDDDEPAATDAAADAGGDGPAPSTAGATDSQADQGPAGSPTDASADATGATADDIGSESEASDPPATDDDAAATGVTPDAGSEPDGTDATASDQGTDSGTAGAGGGDAGPSGLVLPDALVGADTVGDALVAELEAGRIDHETVGRLVAASGGDSEIASWDRVETMERDIERVDDRLEELNGRVEGLDERLAGVDEATPSQDAHDRLTERVEILEADADGATARLDAVDDRLDDFTADLEAIRADVDDAATAADLASLQAEIQELREDLAAIDGFRGRVERVLNLSAVPDEHEPTDAHEPTDER